MDLEFRELRWHGSDGETRHKLQFARVEPTGTRPLVWEDVPIYDVSKQQFFDMRDAPPVTEDQIV